MNRLLGELNNEALDGLSVVVVATNTLGSVASETLMIGRDKFSGLILKRGLRAFGLKRRGLGLDLSRDISTELLCFTDTVACASLASTASFKSFSIAFASACRRSCSMFICGSPSGTAKQQPMENMAITVKNLCKDKRKHECNILLALNSYECYVWELGDPITGFQYI